MEKMSSKEQRNSQKKAFTTWTNNILQQRKRSRPKIENLFKCLRSGQLLGEVLEQLSGETFRHLSSGNSRSQSVHNVKICLKFLEEKRISTKGISSEDIVDGCPYTTLELMWTIITGLFLNKKELLKKHPNQTVEEALLCWVQDKTKHYRHVRVEAFTSSSWKDGMAFLALIDAHRPDIINFSDYYSDERRYNIETVLAEAEQKLGIARLLDVEDLMKLQVDEKALATYVICFYERFTVPDQRKKGSSCSGAENSRSDMRRRNKKRPGGNEEKHRDNSSSSSRCSSSRSCNSNSNKRSRDGRGRVDSRSSSSSLSNRSDRNNRRKRSRDGRGRVDSRSSSSSLSNRSDRNNRRERSRNGRGRVDSRSSSSSLSNRSDRNIRRKRSRNGRGRVDSRSSSSSLSNRSDRNNRRERSRDRPGRVDSKYKSNYSPKTRRNMNALKNKGEKTGRKQINSEDRRYDLKRKYNKHHRNCSRSPVRKGRTEHRRGSPEGNFLDDLSKRKTRDRRFYDTSPGSSNSSVREKRRWSNQHDGSEHYHLRRNIGEKLDTFNSSSRPDYRTNHETEFERLQEEDILAAFNDLFVGAKVNSPSYTVPCNRSPVLFEWQFQNEHGDWITYGMQNSDPNANAETTTSDDIENYYIANPSSPPVIIKTKCNSYELDFQRKMQRNLTTSIRRPVRRISKQAGNITPVPVPMNSSAAVSFEWQFQDEHGLWITYGKANSAGNLNHVSTTSSDDIEKHYSSNLLTPTPLTINSNNSTQYVLDFVSMKQTNKKTSIQRPIRRISKQSPNTAIPHLGQATNIGGNPKTDIVYEWQLADDVNGSWITYGKPNAKGDVSHMSTTSSDEIERHFISHCHHLFMPPLTINSKNNIQYQLDFNNMTQTNMATSFKRTIRRVQKMSTPKKATNGNSCVWSFKDEHGNWVKFANENTSGDDTVITSDQIEKGYVQNNNGVMEMITSNNKYVFDFTTMIVTNIDTKVDRAICRDLVATSDLPLNWTPMTAADKGLRVVPLNSTDAEYIKQVAEVTKTLPTKHSITKMFRIQNEHVWKDYVIRKRSLIERNPTIKYKELYLFHGTDPKNLQEICQDNLDFRLHGTNGVVYGKGTYFATSSAYSARYCGNGPTKVMFIVKVLIGHYTVGNNKLSRPPKNSAGVFYDATVDNQNAPTIYVKYNNADYYPEYYFEFT